jgi:hypothetical protein
MAGPAHKSTLLNYYKRPGLTADDRRHVKDWLEQASDPVWDEIVDDTKKYGELPEFVEGPFHFLITSALRARRRAESAEYISPAQEKEQEQQRAQQERTNMLELASKIDDVVLHCRNRPPLDIDGSSPEELRRRESLQWFEHEAEILRQHAARNIAGEPFLDDWLDGPLPVRASRQSGGEGKRDQSRALGVFMVLMTNFMYQACGKPRHNAVSMLTNIAFTKAKVTEDDVRSACRRVKHAVRSR